MCFLSDSVVRQRKHQVRRGGFLVRTLLLQNVADWCAKGPWNQAQCQCIMRAESGA